MVKKLKNKLPKKIFIKTFGCQMNEYDSNRILSFAKNLNYNSTENISEADCYVLNTCHIREKSTEKVYHDVGRVKKVFRNRKKPILLVTGCVAQAEGAEMLKRESYIDAVVGPQSYHKIPEIIEKVEKRKFKINETDFNVIEKFDKLNLIKNEESKISSFLTIQEGCDKFCNFCVVPYTRGPEFSRSFKEIILEAEQLVHNGVREITLLGQNVNAYKYENYRLSDLIKKLNTFKDLRRIRYTTSHPKDMTPDLIKVHGSCEKLMPILHLPVQSGSSHILKKMNRKHNMDQYLKIISELKKTNPLIKFSSDFIIGYPGETDNDFLDTINLMKSVKFINSYSFIFSPRPGTPASKLMQINKEISKKRLEQFQKISEEIKIRYRQELLNKEIKVLFENKIKDTNKIFGRDQYMNAVVVDGNLSLVGKEEKVLVQNFNSGTLFGKVNYSNLVEAS